MADEEKEIACKCGYRNPVGAKRCGECNCALTRVPCKVCGEPIRFGAKYCNDCKSYQNLRQYLPGFSAVFMALLTAALSTLPAALNALTNYRNRNSKTMMIVTDADENGVHVQFRNSGLKFAQIAKVQLIFDKSLNLPPADLQQAEIGNTLIRPNEPLNAVFRLSAALQRPKGVTDEEILQNIQDKGVKLRCVIAESDDANHVLPEIDLPEKGALDLISKGLPHA